MRYSIFFTAVLTLALIGCGGEPGQHPANRDISIDSSAVVSEGQMISQAAFKTLSSNLQQAMAEGGVENALRFCNIEAMPLTDSLSTHFDIELRRASHRPRNPSNRADSLELQTIQQYLSEIEAGRDLKPVIYTSGSTISYHAPIRIAGPLCLNCHGQPATDIAKPDLQVIRELYPEDEATGFSLGELRGIWSIRFPADYFDAEPQVDEE
ncbi:DUF3365 domain-containing protein [Halalkalibaculum sp. DA3122]|uniref:Tll0287-like domain-containing protein n=1 Tax=unclassified Halalkalibaculum TaxID=2964617 RepID=UPI003753F18F